MNIQKFIIALALLLGGVTAATAQVAVKTNLAGWGTTTANIGVEVGLSRHATLQVLGYLNPWEFGEDRHFRLWSVQPEYRWWWSCGKYNGHFLGIHALGGEYNAKRVNFPLRGLLVGGSLTERNDAFPSSDHEGLWPDIEGANAGRHVEGWYIGGGLSYGYQWILSRHWNFEASVGVGYVYSPLSYYGRCAQVIDRRELHYVGPTNAQLSFVYVF